MHIEMVRYKDTDNFLIWNEINRPSNANVIKALTFYESGAFKGYINIPRTAVKAWWESIDAYTHINIEGNHVILKA